MKYIVKIDYKPFTFYDRNEALDFADMAAAAADRLTSVSIEVVKEGAKYE